ncbi:MAG: AMP-binding protein [Spirochaetota bacterium]|jgi:acetyl-CoA synthetase/medium-chain acyl-CoA synthetase|nr:AMP-binding protein [Spirochaetota bacterium]
MPTERDYREYSIEYPRYFNFAFDVMDRHAGEIGDHVALHFIDENQNEEKITFREIRVLSNRIANFLQSIGVQQGMRVLIMLPRVPAWWLIMIALSKLGAVAVPATTSLQANEIEYRIRNAAIDTIFVSPADADKLDAIHGTDLDVKNRILVGGERENWINFWDAVRGASDDFASGAARTPIETPMLLYFTSGTSGYPKMVLHTQSYALAHRSTTELWHDLKPDDTVWIITDTGWAKNAWGALYGAWYLGATIFVHQYAHFRAERTLRLIAECGITVFCAPPSAYRLLIHEDLGKYDFGKLRRCTSAGEALAPEIIALWKEKSGLEIYEGYGQSESVLLVGNFAGLPLRPGSMGKPSPLFNISILDNDCSELPPHAEGIIAVRTEPKHPEGLFTGYMNDANLNASVFRDGWYLTGDRAYKDEDGYYWFIGRADDVIKSLGIRIGPFEIESALAEHEAVSEAAVIGVANRMKGQHIKAFIVLKPGYTPSVSLARQIQSFARAVLSSYKCPKEIEFIGELPKTVNGKLRRLALREREAHKADQNPAT